MTREEEREREEREKRERFQSSIFLILSEVFRKKKGDPFWKKKIKKCDKHSSVHFAKTR
jgi:hypothetical protein